MEHYAIDGHGDKVFGKINLDILCIIKYSPRSMDRESIITFRLETDKKEQLERAAERDDLTVAQILRRLVNEFLQSDSSLESKLPRARELRK